MLGVQHLDVPHLRGRTERKETGVGTGKGKETVDCTGRGTDKGRINKGGDKGKKEPKSTKEVGTSEQVGISGSGDRVKKDKADQKEKATQTWSDLVKGLKTRRRVGERRLGEELE